MGFPVEKQQHSAYWLSGSLEAGVRIILIAAFSGSLKTGESKKNEQQVVASVR
ncbi:hypothetical protein [Kingella oralis]|jgi:hypothetical protein|uniref:hypothetical protein n=1 Tax=Kingella oralis TaxID=505 RepID=UPI003C6EFCB4